MVTQGWSPSIVDARQLFSLAFLNFEDPLLQFVYNIFSLAFHAAEPSAWFPVLLTVPIRQAYVIVTVDWSSFEACIGGEFGNAVVFEEKFVIVIVLYDEAL